MHIDDNGIRWKVDWNTRVDNTAPPYAVRFDGQAVLYVNDYHVQPNGEIEVLFPEFLKPYLQGKSRVSVTNSVTNEEVVAKNAKFGDSKGRVSIKDADGHPLFVTKWNRMGHALGQDKKAQEKLIEVTKKLLQECTDLGYNVAICSATLLASMRNGGKILESDDDSDFVVFFETESPAEVNLGMLSLERDLINLGYTVFRESGSQVTIIHQNDNGTVDFYIDFFAGFYTGEYYNQPIMLREVSPPNIMIPFQKVYWEGAYLPAPRNAELYLEQTYGKGWRVPDPAYKHKTRPIVQRYFRRWFGINLNFPREYFENAGAADDFMTTEPDGNDYQLAMIKKHFTGTTNNATGAKQPVLDIGFANGLFTKRIQALGHDILGIDYSVVAAFKTARAYPDLDLRRVNLMDWRQGIELASDIIADGRTWHVNLSHGFHMFIKEARFEVFMLLKRIMRPESRAVISFDTVFVPEKYDRQLPTTWHMDCEMWDAEVERFDFEIVDSYEATRYVPNFGEREFKIVVLKNNGFVDVLKDVGR
ncbi:MAG: hypothetical protein LBL41_01750 [Bifidobacteriaceae bacterium]|jgi:hypothetical protein|nr:hypothetical protein [Bifidobacteriaceae bacterium]